MQAAATSILCGLFLVFSGPGAARADSSDDLARALQGKTLQGARLSVLVVDRQSGEQIFAKNPDQALLPASNQKLLTATAALAHFGPTHRFATEVWAPAKPDAKGRVSSLWIKAGGDPAMTGEQWWRLAAHLRAQGLQEVTGDLILDAGAFDQERWHPSWQPVTARAYHAPLSALTANYSAFRVHVAPGAQPGAPARVQVDPPVAYLELENRTRTGPKGRRTTLRVDRVATGERERVIVGGTVAVNAEGRNVYRSVAHPARYAAAVAGLQLEAVGIQVGGRTRFGSAPAEDSQSAELLLRFEGHPVSKLVALFLKNSNNMMGEAFIKAMGRGEGGEPGTWQNGRDALRRILTELGLDLSGVKLADGSGLSRDNRVSARFLVNLLRAADAEFRIGPELFAALPIAGRDGTLRRRAAGALDQVRAKTGLLTGVTGLSGVARTAGGREVVFSILANGYRRGDRAAMDALDGFAEAITRLQLASDRWPRILAPD